MQFDYVIVGAGSAGCVLASRLSENNQNQVLLIEAGDDISSDLALSIPLGVGKLLNNKQNLWADITKPSGGTLQRKIDWISGKCIGGSSAINGMIFVRGHPIRYDDWVTLGCNGWSYKDCLPYFKKLEDCQFSSSNLRHRGGPIGSALAEKDEISELFIKACIENGYPRVIDYNAEIPDGVGYLQLSSKNGKRVSSAKGYLDNISHRKNLTILKNAQVNKILFSGNQAIGVSYIKNNQIYEALADKEVILCAGAIRSPKLLELSGVGNPKILNNYSIPVVFENAFVGENLQDHFMTRICYETSSKDTVNYMMSNKFSLGMQLLNYLVFKKGIFSTTTLKSTAYLRSNASEAIPNLRIQVSLMSAEGRIPESGNSGLDLAGIRASLDPGSAFHIGVYGIYPDSSGYSHINSLDINSPSNIQPNYLDTARDQKTIIEGLQLIRKLAESPALKNIITKEIRPTKQVSSNDDLLNFAKETGHTCWHPIGTCKMGLEKNSVVDINCKVFGTTKLRVVDGSVLPMHISSNTNIPILMLAEKISDSIAQANQK